MSRDVDIVFYVVKPCQKVPDYRFLLWSIDGPSSLIRLLLFTNLSMMASAKVASAM